MIRAQISTTFTCISERGLGWRISLIVHTSAACFASIHNLRPIVSLIQQALQSKDAHRLASEHISSSLKQRSSRPFLRTFSRDEIERKESPRSFTYSIDTCPACLEAPRPTFKKTFCASRFGIAHCLSKTTRQPGLALCSTMQAYWGKHMAISAVRRE